MVYYLFYHSVVRKKNSGTNFVWVVWRERKVLKKRSILFCVVPDHFSNFAISQCLPLLLIRIFFWINCLNVEFNIRHFPFILFLLHFDFKTQITVPWVILNSKIKLLGFFHNRNLGTVCQHSLLLDKLETSIYNFWFGVC